MATNTLYFNCPNCAHRNEEQVDAQPGTSGGMQLGIWHADDWMMGQLVGKYVGGKKRPCSDCGYEMEIKLGITIS